VERTGAKQIRAQEAKEIKVACRFRASQTISNLSFSSFFFEKGEKHSPIVPHHLTIDKLAYAPLLPSRSPLPRTVSCGIILVGPQLLILRSKNGKLLEMDSFLPSYTFNQVLGRKYWELLEMLSQKLITYHVILSSL
jgi:hypothetical protein